MRPEKSCNVTDEMPSVLVPMLPLEKRLNTVDGVPIVPIVPFKEKTDVVAKVAALQCAETDDSVQTIKITILPSSPENEGDHQPLQPDNGKNPPTPADGANSGVIRQVPSCPNRRYRRPRPSLCDEIRNDPDLRSFFVKSFIVLCFFLTVWLVVSQLTKEGSGKEKMNGDDIPYLLLKSRDKNCSLTMNAPNLPIICSPTNSNSQEGKGKTAWRVIGFDGHSTSDYSHVRSLQLQTLWKRHKLCLTIGDSDYLTVTTCEQTYPLALEKQLFTFTLKAETEKPKVPFFDISSHQHPNKCIELYKDAKLGEIFLMAPCNNKQDSQLFYFEVK